MNTFEAPPRSPRVDLPAPFIPRLPAPLKRQTVLTVPSPQSMVGKVELAAPAPTRPGGTPPPAVAGSPTTIGRQKASWLRRATMRVATMLVVMGVAAGGVSVYQHFKVEVPPRPKAWDPRVANIVAFVERERGLRFEHPIFIDFLSQTEYTLATAPVGPVDDGTRAAARYRSDLLDVFGLASGYDALAGDGVMRSSSTLGFYSPTTDRITLRGNEMTPAMRVVIAHELTHALQAQHFDLRLGGADDLARRSIAEADAMRVEDAYLATLPPEDQSQAIAANSLTPETSASLATVPWPVVELGYAPYQLGPSFLQSVYLRRGNAGVDGLFEHPPTERMLLTPWRHLADDTDVSVTVTAPPSVDVLHSSQPLTMIQLLVMLDAWLPWSMARGSLDTLAGAAYTTYRYGDAGPFCMTAVAQFDGDPQPFATALQWWAGASGSSAVPTVEGNRVSFEACARGVGAASPPVPLISPSRAVLIENAAVPVGAEVDGVRNIAPFLCTARALIDDPNIAPLLLKSAPSPEELTAIDAARNNALLLCSQ